MNEIMFKDKFSNKRWIFYTAISILFLLFFMLFLVLDDGGVPAQSKFAININRVRNLAKSKAGNFPTQVRVSEFARNQIPAGSVIAGAGFSPYTMARTSFQIVYPDGHAIIDTGMNRALADRVDKKMLYEQSGYDEIVSAMETAKVIVITHLHGDHIGGAAHYPNPGKLEHRLILSREQADDTKALTKIGFSEDVKKIMRVVEYEDYLAVLPGLVLIKSAGHTKGHQMMYVQLADGQEYLFVGDVGWSMDNITIPRGKPRGVSDFIVTGEERALVLDQLRSLHEFRKAEPQIIFVVSHDQVALDLLLREGSIKQGFLH